VNTMFTVISPTRDKASIRPNSALGFSAQANACGHEKEHSRYRNGSVMHPKMRQRLTPAPLRCAVGTRV
jgi:hypothetical protein